MYPVQGFSLKALQHLVLDEADRLLNMDFEQEIDQILKVGVPTESGHAAKLGLVGWVYAGMCELACFYHNCPAHVRYFPTAPTVRRCILLCRQVIPKERRTQLFSATMTTKVAKLQRACLRDPVKVEVAQKYSTVDTLRQQYLFIPAKHKVR